MISHHPVDQQGETIVVRFYPHVEPCDDPHLYAEAVERAGNEATIYTVRTRVLPGALYEKLLRSHPAVEDGYEFNPDTFPPALLHESIIGWSVSKAGAVLEDEARQPTLEETTELWEQWPKWARRELVDPIRYQNIVGPALGKVMSRRNGPAA